MQTNPWGTIRFTDKVALITGGASGIGERPRTVYRLKVRTSSSLTTTPKWHIKQLPKSKKQVGKHFL